MTTARSTRLRDHHRELVDAVDRLPELAPASCRAHALESLDIARCVRGYEQVFSRVVAAGSPRSAPARIHVAARNGTTVTAPVASTQRPKDHLVPVPDLLTTESS